MFKSNQGRTNNGAVIVTEYMRTPDICHRHHRRCLWRKICHVEKILHISDCNVEKFSIWQILMWKTFSACMYEWEMSTESVMWINFVHNIWCTVAFYTDLLQNLLFLWFTLLCCKVCFVALHALLRGGKIELNIARGTTDPGYCLFNLSYLFS